MRTVEKVSRRNSAAVALALGVFGCGDFDQPTREGTTDVGGSGCVEEQSEIRVYGGPIAIQAQEALQPAAMPREATIDWIDGGSTTVSMQIENATAYDVRSRSPDQGPLIVLDCRDHVALEADVSINTADGRVAVSKRVKLRFRDAALRAVLVLEDAELESYRRSELEDAQCLHALQINIGIAENAFGGSMIETITRASCDDTSSGVSGGPREVTRWGDDA